MTLAEPDHPGPATDDLPWDYLADLDSARHQLAGAAPGEQFDRFQAIVTEHVRWITVRGMDQTVVFGDLLRAAAGVGLGEEEARDALHDALVCSRTEIAKKRRNTTGAGWRSRCITATKLGDLEFLPIVFVVPDVIPEGVTILAGKPKVGKSWMALDVCVAVAAGGTCLGQAESAEADVLYVALEDNHRRLQRRMHKRMGNERWPTRLTLATEWRRLDEGGLADMEAWCATVAAPRLIVIDTLAAIRPVRSSSGYREDYEALSELQRFAGEHGVAVVVLHHLRKMSAEDPFDTVSGTLGLTGSADTVLVLARQAGGVTLHGRGRDIEEFAYAMEFDPATCRWTILGEADDVKRSEQREAILVVLGDEERAVADIVAATSMPRNNVDRLLHSMMKDGEVERPARGIYRRASMNR